MNDRHTLHPLDAALQLRWQEEGLVGLATDANYWNTAGPFGGWLLAAGIKAVLTDPRAEGTPVEAHARFLAAPKSGELELRVELQSQGRSVGFWHVAIWQRQARGPRLCAEISVILAEERETAHFTRPIPGARASVGYGVMIFDTSMALHLRCAWASRTPRVWKVCCGSGTPMDAPTIGSASLPSPTSPHRGLF